MSDLADRIIEKLCSDEYLSPTSSDGIRTWAADAVRPLVEPLERQFDAATAEFAVLRDQLRPRDTAKEKPPMNTYVLAYLKHSTSWENTMYATHPDAGPDAGFISALEGFMRVEDVAAWMPLPPSPEVKP